MEAAITEILDRHRDDPEELRRALIPAVYTTLKRMAVHQVRREAATPSLQPTALVNEVYLRLLGGEARWQNRRHFMAAAAEAMRRILIEGFRRRRRLKRGGGLLRSDLDPDCFPAAGPERELLDLHRLLDRFEEAEPRKAAVVKLRYFLGLSIRETAEALDVSIATVKLDWAFAKAWLWRELDPPQIDARAS